MDSATLKQVAPKACGTEGCCRPVKARGMCTVHYSMWMRKQPQAMRGYELTLKTVKDAMPGTNGELREATGMCSETIARSLKRLKARGEIHIGSWSLPMMKGQKYQPIWHAGPGRDKVLRPEVRKKHMRQQELACERRSAAKKKLRERAVPAIGAAEMWAAPLLLAA